MRAISGASWRPSDTVTSSRLAAALGAGFLSAGADKGAGAAAGPGAAAHPVDANAAQAQAQASTAALEHLPSALATFR
jgi:hypothetical protein